MSLFKSTKEERIVTLQKNKSRVKFLEMEVRLLSEKKDLLKIFFKIIVIFLDKYIKTLLTSNKILSENVKPISGIKLKIIG